MFFRLRPMYFTISLWLVAVSTQLAHPPHVQKAFHPILLEEGTRAPNMMNDIIFNLTSFTPPWLETFPPGLDKRALSRRAPPVSQQKNPPNGRSYPGVQWDETCSDEQITIILQALGDAYIMAQATQQTMEELQTEFTATTNNYPTDPGLQAKGTLSQVQGDVILRMAPMVRKFFALDGPGGGWTWPRILTNQLTAWQTITATMDKPDSAPRSTSPNKILRLACNLGGTNPDGSKADDIQNGSDENLCYDPSNPNGDAQALSFVVDTAHNDVRTYTGINAAVINFCRDFFYLHGTTTPRPSDNQKQQDFKAEPAGQGGFKNIDLSALDTTARIVLHEMFHQSWTLDLNPGLNDKIGYQAIAAAAGNGYAQTRTLPDAWAWSGVWARWMKFKELLTCDLYPANA